MTIEINSRRRSIKLTVANGAICLEVTDRRRRGYSVTDRYTIGAKHEVSTKTATVGGITRAKTTGVTERIK